MYSIIDVVAVNASINLETRADMPVLIGIQQFASAGTTYPKPPANSKLEVRVHIQHITVRKIPLTKYIVSMRIQGETPRCIEVCHCGCQRVAAAKLTKAPAMAEIPLLSIRSTTMMLALLPTLQTLRGAIVNVGEVCVCAVVKRVTVRRLPLCCVAPTPSSCVHCAVCAVRACELCHMTAYHVVCSTLTRIPRGHMLKEDDDHIDKCDRLVVAGLSLVRSEICGPFAILLEQVHKKEGRNALLPRSLFFLRSGIINQSATSLTTAKQYKPQATLNYPTTSKRWRQSHVASSERWQRRACMFPGLRTGSPADSISPLRATTTKLAPIMVFYAL